MAKANEIPMKEIQQAFEISAESPSGLVWKIGNKEGRHPGKPAGSRQIGISKGSFLIRFQGKGYKVSRIVASLSLGFPIPPAMVVDHIDGNPSNNSPSNLRICTQKENSWNKGLAKNNHCGVKGVQKKANGWMARFNGAYLGFYSSIKEAGEAYRKAAELHYGVFARTV